MEKTSIKSFFDVDTIKNLQSRRMDMKEMPYSSLSKPEVSKKEFENAKRHRTLSLFQEEIDEIVQNLLPRELKNEEDE